MTKLEILRSYTNAKIRDAWVALGSQSITSTTKIYVKDTIYQIDVAGSLFDGALIFCKDSYQSSTAFPWAGATLIDEKFISFGNDIISPYFELILTSTDLAAIAEPIDYDFVPFEAEFAQTSVMQIPEDELELIMLDVGVPFITYEELEYSREKITNLMVKPAIEEYFKWFPKVRTEIAGTSGNNSFNVEFPSDAYGVVHIALTQGRPMNGTTNPLLRFFDELVWIAGNPSYQGMSSRKPGSRNFVNDWSSMMMDKAARQALVNWSTRTHYEVVEEDGKKYVQGYSNKMGNVQITFAIKTLNWDDVEFSRRPEVRKLATAKVLRAFGQLRSQVRTDIPGSVDYTGFLTRADALEQAVITDWQSLTKFAGIMRGGL